VLTRGSRELTASVRSSWRCRGVQRGTGAAVHGGSAMAARWRSGGEGVEEEKGLFTGRGCSFYSRWRRWNESGTTVRHRRCGLGADVQAVRLTGGPHVVSIFFQFI
jgi:hypothetical protein